MRFGGTGLRDWFVQRLTAVFLAAYTIFWVVYFSRTPAIDFNSWQQLWMHPLLKLATVMAVISIAWHAWIGLWTVSTDYVKPVVVRLIFQGGILCILLSEVLWGLWIVWGNGR